MIHITVRDDEDGQENSFDCEAAFIATNTHREDGSNTGTCYVNGHASIQAAAGALTNLVRESDNSVSANGMLAMMVGFTLNARK